MVKWTGAKRLFLWGGLTRGEGIGGHNDLALRLSKGRGTNLVYPSERPLTWDPDLVAYYIKGSINLWRAMMIFNRCCGGRGKRSGQVVHCEPVSVSLFSKQARSSWPAFRPEGTQNKQLRLLRVQLAYQGPETLFGAKRTLPFLHRPKEMMLRLGGSHFALQEGNYHSLLSSSLFFPTFSGIGPLL